MLIIFSFGLVKVIIVFVVILIMVLFLVVIFFKVFIIWLYFLVIWLIKVKGFIGICKFKFCVLVWEFMILNKFNIFVFVLCLEIFKLICLFFLEICNKKNLFVINKIGYII